MRATSRRCAASCVRRPGSTSSTSARSSTRASTRSRGTADIIDQRERFYLVRVDRHDAVPTIDVAAEGVTEVRWWTLDELDATDERIVPSELAALVRSLAP